MPQRNWYILYEEHESGPGTIPFSYHLLAVTIIDKYAKPTAKQLLASSPAGESSCQIKKKKYFGLQ